MANAASPPIHAMSSTTVSDLVDHFRIETQLHPDFTLEIVRAVQPRGRRIVRTEKRWTKDSELGYGTFGEVWLERNQKGETRAVKGVKKRKNTEIDYYKELLAMAKLSKHLQLFVEFFGWYETKDSLFIAMEYLEHGDLHKHVIRTGTCSENDAKAIAYQLLEGLAVMHELGFAHRDLKPQNIFVSHPSPDWWIKIGDFGIAKRVQTTDETAFRTEIGTRVYRAPEVDCLLDEESEEYTHLVDIWSLGCVIFWILTKEVPFASTSKVLDFVHKKISFPSTPLEKKSASPDCLQFLQRAITVQPFDRPTAQIALESQWLKDLDAELREEESPLVLANTVYESRHSLCVPRNDPTLSQPPKVPQQAELNESKKAGLRSNDDEPAFENEKTSEDLAPSVENKTALSIQVKTKLPISDDRPTEELQLVTRAAKIVEVKPEPEETLESRVRRITARVAELTGNMNDEQGATLLPQSHRTRPDTGKIPERMVLEVQHRNRTNHDVSQDEVDEGYVDCPRTCGERILAAELQSHLDMHFAEDISINEAGNSSEVADKLQTQDTLALKETRVGHTDVTPQVPRSYSPDPSSLVIKPRKMALFGGYKNRHTYDLLQSIKDRNDGMFLRALNLGADRDVILKDGDERLAVIQLVAKYGSVTMLEALLVKGTAPSSTSSTRLYGTMPLHFAVMRNSISMVKELLRPRAPFDVVALNDHTVLTIAAHNGFVDLAQFLLERGADVEGDSLVCSPLISAICGSNSGTRLQMVKRLIEWRANVNAIDHQGDTPLHHAVLWGRFAEAELLLVAGGNLNAVDKNGKTAMNRAMEGRNLSQFRFLSLMGAELPPKMGLSRNARRYLEWLQDAAKEPLE